MTYAYNRPEFKKTRQNLRSSMPSAEVILWSKLQRRQLLGCKFRRQFGIEEYTVGFYSPDIKLAIELDGESHYRGSARARDQRRDATIRSYGIEVLRFLNDDVYDNLEGVWEAIARKARERLLELRPADAPGRRVRRARRP